MLQAEKLVSRMEEFYVAVGDLGMTLKKMDVYERNERQCFAKYSSSGAACTQMAADCRAVMKVRTPSPFRSPLFISLLSFLRHNGRESSVRFLGGDRFVTPPGLFSRGCRDILHWFSSFESLLLYLRHQKACCECVCGREVLPICV